MDVLKNAEMEMLKLGDFVAGIEDEGDRAFVAMNAIVEVAMAGGTSYPEMLGIIEEAKTILREAMLEAYPDEEAVVKPAKKSASSKAKKKK